MTRSKYGTGTVRTVRDRRGAVVGYQALLPRHLSEAPPGHPSPESYRQQVGELQATQTEARELLDAVILELRQNPIARGAGDRFSTYADLEIDDRLQQARRAYPTEARANKAVATWRSARDRWLESAPFWSWSPQDITAADLQDWVDGLARATGQRGKPLSPHFVRNVVGFVRATLDRVKDLRPNPAADLELPRRPRPVVPYLRLANQRQFFGDRGVELADRCMVGCGMGPGLRVNELLAQEAADVHLDGPDPHLEVNYGGPDRSPTKGRQRRIVELFEPGLGFWRLWMTRFYRGGRLVFEGPRGGYQRHWPELFPGWVDAAGFPGLTSHIMRHTYAVAMLSGTWGYDPRSLEFVSDQLGHSSIQVTERYYGAFEQGVSRDTVRRMTGRIDAGPRVVVTAEALLGKLGGTIGGAVSASGGSDNEIPHVAFLPRHSPQRHEVAEKQPDPADTICGTRQALNQALRTLELIAGGAVAASPAAVDALATAARALQAELEAREPEAHAG